MTMFEELYALAMSATLAMVISADEKTGRMTINVVPRPKKDVGEPALTKDLSLTATPAEFDTGFVNALKGYRKARQSLAEQAEATREVLQAAKTASTKKAGEAMTKAAKLAPGAAAPEALPNVSQGAADDLDNEAQALGSGTPQAPATTATSGESFDLFG